MAPSKKGSKEVTAYISGFPPDVARILRRVRATIRKAAPQAEETISYMMPGYRLNGQLVWFAAFKKHIGFFPRGHSAIDAFKTELKGYALSKGTVRFPLDKPIPYTLISKMVKFRVNESMAEKKTRP
jgi:uncharacterized protein YdhG (YjbR/CyaY superfamily)